MENQQQFEIWKEELSLALESKVEEFHMFGYDRVTTEDIWNCVVAQLQKEKEFVHLHAFVNKLLTLKPQTYMKWLTVQTYKNPEDLFREYETDGN